MKTEIFLFVGTLFCGFCVTKGQRECYSCVYSFNEAGVGYECVDEPWNVDTANVVTCPDTDDQGRPLFCHTFTQQIKAVQEATQFSCEPKMKRGQDIRFSICSYVAEKPCGYYETMTMYIWSMLRSCQVVTVDEGCVDDANFRSCYSYCEGNLCNDEDQSDKEDEPF